MREPSEEHRAIFLDRDGVVNENREDYVKNLSELVFLPGVFESFKKLAGTSFKIILLTNQSAVGRGLLKMSELDEIHKEMISKVQANGGRIDAVYFCPHHPNEKCDCRKPKPGLILKAAEELCIDLPGSFLIGDAISDIEAALNAGCHPVLVLTGRGKRQVEEMSVHLRSHCRVFDDLNQSVNWILETQE